MRNVIAMDSELYNLRRRLETLEEDKRYLLKELEKWRQSAEERAQLIEEIQNDPWVRLGSRLRLVKRRDVAPATLEMSTLSEAGADGLASPASGRDQDAYPNWELRTDEGSEAHLIYPREDHEMVRVAIIKAKAQTDWGIQLNRRGLKVSSGERYAVVFRARSARPGTIGLGFAKADAPWSSLGLYAKLHLNPEWQTFREEFVALEDEDNARIHFDLGKNKVGMDLTSVSVELVKEPGVLDVEAEGEHRRQSA
jgi:Carbohydrate binding domain